jgi:hypothetical protein
VPSYTYTKKHQLKTRSKSSGLQLVVSIAGIFLFLVVFVQLYIMSVYAPKGDEVAKLEQRKRELVSENKNLHEEIAEARKLEFIREKSANEGYVDINTKDVSYIVIE